MTAPGPWPQPRPRPLAARNPSIELVCFLDYVMRQVREEELPGGGYLNRLSIVVDRPDQIEQWADAFDRPVERHPTDRPAVRYTFSTFYDLVVIQRPEGIIEP